MRGKKSAEPEQQLGHLLRNEEEKRAAFVGMRGKKSFGDNSNAEDDRELLELILNRYLDNFNHLKKVNLSANKDCKV